MRIATLILIVWLASDTPAVAQSLPIDPQGIDSQIPTNETTRRDSTRTADTGAGEVGQRRTREDMASFVEPLGRIDNRLQTRVQNRLRNRIDRYYDPRANATAPFRSAVDRARVDGSRPRR